MEKSNTEKFSADLTPDEINDITEISLDKEMADKTLMVALQHHSNQHNEYTKRQQIFWEALGKKHNLDIKAKGYKIDSSGTRVKVVEADEA